MEEVDFSSFDPSSLCGWYNSISSIANAVAPSEFQQPLLIFGSGPTSRRMLLFEAARKAIGADIYDYSIAKGEVVAQQIGDCLKENTDILLSNGKWKKIQDVLVGENIISHLGNIKKVTRTIKKKYTGRLYTIKADGHYKSLTTTADHKYPVYSNSTLYDYEWKPASELKIDVDNIIIPYGIQSFTYQYIEFQKRKILVDEVFASIIGWYLAEGGISNKELKDETISYQKVTFNLCIDENDVADYLIEKLASTFGVVGVKQYHKTDQNVLLVEVYNVDFATLIHNLVPGNVYSKRIPEIIINSPYTVKLALLRSWMKGDGYQTENHIEGTTSSYNLVQDVFHLSVSCSLSPRVKYIPKQEHQNIDAAITTFRGNSFSTLTRMPLSVRNLDYGKYKYVRLSNIGLLRTITEISYEEVEDIDVYCLEVEDDGSFIANGYGISNCVSWGAKHAIEYLQCVQMLMGNWDSYKVIFSPYLYGCGRVYIGGQRGGGDGSVGVWQAQAVIKYGSLSTDTPNLPKYNGNVARQFGSSQNLLDQWQPEGKKHLVKSVAKVTTWDDLVQALTNGYPVTVASSVGYEMKPRSDGFHHRSGQWNHQMMIGMVDDDGGDIEPHAGIVNNWGDQHSRIKDFRDPSIDWPPGTLRVRRKDIEIMLAFQDSFAYSGYDGFPAQIVPGMFSSI